MAGQQPTRFVPQTTRMPCPSFVITHNSETSEGQTYGHHDTDPSWCVAFVRYDNPASSYGSKGDITKIRATDPLVIENDCIGVNVLNGKSDFGKRCELTFKAGEVYYPYAVRPGDWVMVWMHDSQSAIDEVVRSIKGLSGKQRSTFDFNSGLKFVGRVIALSSADVMAERGVRTITQTVSCQGFLELASTIYFTGMARYVLNPALEAGTQDPNKQLADRSTTAAALVKEYQQRHKGLMDKYLAILSDQTQQRDGLSPDRIMALILIFTLGIDQTIGSIQGVKDKIDTIRGNFNDSILVPQPVAKMLGRPSATKLWQFYSVYLGVQKYRAGGTMPWSDFSPIVKSDRNEPVQNSSVFRYCQTPCDGAIWFEPPLWNNRPIWSILNDYLNEPVNEMYTALRINPHPSGKGAIQPTIVVREKPFSTGLYNAINNSEGVADKIVQEIKQGKKTVKATKTDPFKDKPRTAYCNLPRWIIDESMIRRINTTVDENDRVNFVQVWGNALNNSTAGFAEGELNRPEIFRQNQVNLPNWYVDQKDVQRHGLRADIAESRFDYVKTSTFGTRVGIWARMRADWLFNGQLRPKGSIVLNGAWEPICEGDNVQVRGIVYHIEAVQHSGVIGGDGKKSFTTQLSVSRGLLATSLTSPDDMPMYPYSRGSSSENEDGPGVTDVQQTISHDNRDEFGERSRRRS